LLFLLSILTFIQDSIIKGEKKMEDLHIVKNASLEKLRASMPTGENSVLARLKSFLPELKAANQHMMTAPQIDPSIEDTSEHLPKEPEPETIQDEEVEEEQIEEAEKPPQIHMDVYGGVLGSEDAPQTDAQTAALFHLLASSSATTVSDTDDDDDDDDEEHTHAPQIEEL
jgi:hypothetical protein